MAERLIVVMKFGGTSVADGAGRLALARRVAEVRDSGRAPVVVVSAMGRGGEPYATDTLLDLLNDLPADDRERDLVAAVGETVAVVVVAANLRASGIESRAFTGAEAGICTDGVFGEAAVTEVHTGPLRSAIEADVVPVVAGFQGIGPDGSVTTLGRGGSDTTACALGVALGAETVEIYTDVDGVATADPRTCSDASVLQTIGADELFQMARHGSRVVHTPAAELALASGITLRVRSTFSDHDGTQVADLSSYQPRGVATAVTHGSGIARVRISLGAAEGTSSHMRAQARIYRAMADAAISLDMFTPTGEFLVFTVWEGSLDRACELLTGLDMAYELRRDLAKVTLVGAGMHGVPGVVARLAEILRDAGVSVIQTADSHTTISVLVPAESAETAVRALHAGFDLGLPDDSRA